MYSGQSSIAAVELCDTRYWLVTFKQNALLSYDDVRWIYLYVNNSSPLLPVLIDLGGIQGMEFDAIEFIALMNCTNQPPLLISPTGSIGTRYVALVEQLSDNDCTCRVYETLQDAISELFEMEKST